jgi:hypothetical protein
MSAADLKGRIRDFSPRLKARIAGGLNLFGLLTASLTGIFVRGSWNMVEGYIAISSLAVVTLLLYDIFKPVSRRLTLLAASLAIVGLTFEALRWKPHGVNIAVVVHGFYCLPIGYLVFRSTFLPRILGLLMAFAGLGWMAYLSPQLVSFLSAYNLTAAIPAELSLIVWLLVMGVNGEKWKEQASAARASIRTQRLPSTTAIGSPPTER